MKWYKLYPADFGADTRHLTLTELGAYQALLNHYYTKEDPLPADTEDLLRIANARTPNERRAVERVAGEFFPLNGDGSRHNKRADREIAKARDISGKRRDAANTRHGNG
jgi:uncharacterized protein YdaU (DUF1376 family)